MKLEDTIAFLYSITSDENIVLMLRVLLMLIIMKAILYVFGEL